MKPFSRFREDLAWIGPQTRIVLAVLAALVLFLCTFSWSVPGLQNLERQAYDARIVANAPERSEDERIVLVVYTDATLISTGRRSPLDRAILAKALRNLDRARPAAIGIDLLFDQPTAEDPALLTTLQGMHVPVVLGTADVPSHDRDDIAYEQEVFLREFARKAGDRVSTGDVGLQSDSDLVTRNWPGAEQHSAPLLAVAMAEIVGAKSDFSEYHGPIDFRVTHEADGSSFAKIPIDVVANDELADVLAESFRGKLVLIGGDLVDIDRVTTPTTHATTNYSMSGTEVQAQMLAQALDGRRITPFPTWANFLLALGSILIGLVLAISVPRKRLLVPLILVFGVAYFALSFGLQAWFGDTRNVGVFGWMIALVATLWLVWTVRRAAKWEKGRTATLALYKYLPPDIATLIVTQPDRLGLRGETRDVFVLFTDLEGFTNLCQSVEAGRVAEFLNEYLEALSQVILAHGGTIDKFVGDAVVAFWGAPVAHDDDGVRAARAAMAVLTESEKFRGGDIGGDIPVGRTRIGLHYGTAIVGNFGGEGRLQDTALGDTMNVGARLEGANKQLKTSILMSGEAYAHVRGSVACRAMGRVRVRGRSAPIEIFEPLEGRSLEEMEGLNASYYAARNGDETALEKLRAWSNEHPGDAAFHGLIERLEGDEGAATDLA